ncbi:MAG: DUF2934 domain-containing protein [Betaproteobacteria bacterium]|nr:DUF2934 domain-containing protein [Betaproteobacteria bacterium]
MPSKTTPPAANPSPRTKTAAAPAAKPRKAVKTTKATQPEAPGATEPAPLLELDLSAGPALLEGPTREQMIRARAYELYERNGCVDGRELEDWLAAEAEVGALMTEDRTRPAA